MPPRKMVGSSCASGSWTLLLLLHLRAAACWAPGGGGGLSYEDRKYWEPHNLTARGEMYFKLYRQHSAAWGITGEKTALAHFWYPELKAYLRGVKSAAPIEKGEEVVRVRHDALLSLSLIHI